MDILREFKEFFLLGGLKEFIEDFRNPKGETVLYFDTKYIHEKDARSGNHFDEVIQEDIVINRHFKDHLKAHLKKIKEELSKRVDELILIKEDNIIFCKNILVASETDFFIIKNQVADTPELKSYTQDLLHFIVEIEAIYKKVLLNGNLTNNHSVQMENENISGAAKLSFGFKGKDDEFLIKLYNLRLDEDGNHRFVNDDKTTLPIFLKLLKSEILRSKKEKIHIVCQIN